MNWFIQKAACRWAIGFLAIVLIQSYGQNRRLLAADTSKNIPVAVADPQDERIYQQIIDYAQQYNLERSSMGDIVQAVAE
ncbi:MAG: hypothetical protein AAFY76_18585, partial [Cyanobacteria bacterium J06649_11]